MITEQFFGKTTTGERVKAYRMQNGRGAEAVILEYGCVVQSLKIPGGDGGITDVVLGYDSLAEYEADDAYLGAAIGRVANRLGRAELTLGVKSYRLAKNDGENHLHGGIRGFDKYIWRASDEGGRLVFSRVSPDGEEGYPGNLSARVAYELTEDSALTITYDAETDADTAVNLTNHSYFNLNGGGSVLGHSLQVFSEAFTENGGGCLPTGRILGVEGTPFDFRTPKPIGRDIGQDDAQLLLAGGYDLNFVLSDRAELKKAAVLCSGQTGITLTVLTTLPGMQLYTANTLRERCGKGGVSIGRYSAVCLETQVFPNAMQFPYFPSPVLRKGEHYHTVTLYAFGTLPS
jgi:aldose 1-epimerase